MWSKINHDRRKTANFRKAVQSGVKAALHAHRNRIHIAQELTSTEQDEDRRKYYQRLVRDRKREMRYTQLLLDLPLDKQVRLIRKSNWIHTDDVAYIIQYDHNLFHYNIRKKH